MAVFSSRSCGTTEPWPKVFSASLHARAYSFDSKVRRIIQRGRSVHTLSTVAEAVTQALPLQCPADRGQR